MTGGAAKTVLRAVQCPCSSCAIMKSNVFYDRMPFLASTTCVGCSIKTVLILTFQTKIKLIQLHNCVHSFYTKHQNNNYILNRHLGHTWVKAVVQFYSYITSCWLLLIIIIVILYIYIYHPKYIINIYYFCLTTK